MIPVLVWWLALQLCGLAALPLAWRLFARLPGRGYPLAKALGLLLIAYLLWLGATLRVLPNDVGGILAAFFVVAGASWWLGRDGLRAAPGAGRGRPRPLVRWLREHRALIVASELLLLVVFVGWAFFRSHSGDVAGTEKPMEFAFINGVLNSRFFPPQDPWLSGYSISYYYFGYVMLAILIRATGVLPAVGFNLAVASWYALVLVGAFGVVYDLALLARREVERRQRTGIGWGLLGALFVGVIGNLEGMLEAGYNARVVPASFMRWLDINSVTDAPPTGAWGGPYYWWWHASRVINDRTLTGDHVEVIDEFPFFSFLLGDLHPHVLALPFVLLAISLALQLFLTAREHGFAGVHPPTAAPAAEPAPALAPDAHVLGLQATSTMPGRWIAGLQSFWAGLGELTGLGPAGIVLFALALGGLGFLNTWDFPIYLGLTLLALAAGLALHDGLTWTTVGRALGGGVLLAVLGWVLYLPFYLGFQSQATGVLPNLLFPTRLSQFFVMFGLFLVVAVFFLALLTVRTAAGGRVGRRFLALFPWLVLVPAGLLAAVVALGIALPAGRSALSGLLDNPAVARALPQATVGQLAQAILRLRIDTPWTYIVLAGLLAWAGALLWAWLAGGRAGAAADADDAAELSLSAAPRISAGDLFAVLMIVLALLLTFSVEFVYLHDNFGTRMNTVFKFYYQAWVLLALAAAYGLSRLNFRRVPLAIQAPALLLAVVLAGAGLVYPLLATPEKAGDFTGPATLDGLAYMRSSAAGDLAAIDWLRQNVPPTAVVAEAPGDSYHDDQDRISMATGNPTLLGWRGHESQWRGKSYAEVTDGREQALDAIYRTARPQDLPALLAQWHIDYVYVGNAERQAYGITDATVSRLDRGLHLVYDAQGVRIYTP